MASRGSLKKKAFAVAKKKPKKKCAVAKEAGAFELATTAIN